MRTHRHIAKRKALYWQVGAVAMLGAAGAAIALPQVRSLFAPPAPPKPPIVLDPARPAPPNYTNLALAQAVKGASDAGAPVAPAPPAPAAPVGPAPADASAPPAAATDWAYLGSIITPAKRSALVRVDGQQQIYSIGSKHGDAKLVSIESEYIEVETGAEKKRIALNERTLLAPTDPPKHAVVFRQPPGIGAGGAGGSMNFNAAARSMANMPGAAPAATFDQARMAAMAAAEAAARARLPSEVPGMTPMEKLNPEELEAASKYLSDPSIADESRGKYLQMLGIGRGAGVEAAMNRLKEAGLDMTSDAGKHIIQAIESNSRSKP